MSFLFPSSAPTPPPPPKVPSPDTAMVQADREATMLRRRRGRSSTILSDETKATGNSQPLKTLLGE